MVVLLELRALAHGTRKLSGESTDGFSVGKVLLAHVSEAEVVLTQAALEHKLRHQHRLFEEEFTRTNEPSLLYIAIRRALMNDNASILPSDGGSREVQVVAPELLAGLLQLVLRLLP